MATVTREQFQEHIRRAREGAGAGAIVCAPVAVKLLADQLTPVVAYRRLVAPDARTAPSFLLESVEGGERQGRFSILSAQPHMELVAYGQASRLTTHGGTVQEWSGRDPFDIARSHTRGRVLVDPESLGLPRCFVGGWVGYAAYDSVRYGEPGKLPFSLAPRDDRHLPDLHLCFHNGVVVFDHVQRVVFVTELAHIAPGEDAGAKYDIALASIAQRVRTLEQHSEPLHAGEMPPPSAPGAPLPSNMTPAQHATMVKRVKEYIRAGDVFQVVLGQRFERVSRSDPFDVYRALRAVNPSPYMVYMQAEGCILVASSPEILCRVKRGGTGTGSSQFTVTNRPLAGTRRRGKDAAEDAALADELLADMKERAEHIMLVDLGRNDVGVVADPGSIALPAVMEIERYSHVMHISSTVTGTLRPGLDCWDALRAALPVGTISGAPKVRAMQVIDELEPIRRGPYGGGMGCVGLDGQMDIALTLRTMVVPTALRTTGADGHDRWVYHLQASGGIVADSDTDAEFTETVNKAAALARAIDVAEAAFPANG